MVRKKKDRTELIRCACGLCNELIPKIDKYGRERKYKRHHACKTKDRETWIYCACNCGQKLLKYNKHGYERKYIHNHLQVMLNKEKAQGWTIDHYGYKLLHRPNHHFANSKGYVPEHRIIWEEYYNVCLLPWAEIHHKNIGNLPKWENKHDNRIENLELLSKAEHRRLHHKGKPKPKKFLSNVSRK